MKILIAQESYHVGIVVVEEKISIVRDSVVVEVIEIEALQDDFSASSYGLPMSFSG